MRESLRLSSLVSDPGRAGLRLGVGERVVSARHMPVPDVGLVVFECRHAPGFCAALKDRFAKFLLLIAGHALWESDGRRYSVSPDTLFHIAPEVPHQQRDLPGQPVTLYAIHYRPDLLPADLVGHLSQTGMLPLNLHRAGADYARRVRTLVQEMMFEQETHRPGWEALLVARLTELAVVMVRGSQNRTFTVDRSEESTYRVAGYAARLRHEFYAAVSLDEAARSVGLGRRRFTELFREVTGESWRRYVHRLRMEHACRLLASTERSVTAIAFECGFEELSHFHHSFKAALGSTPLAYRTLSRQPRSA